MSQHCIHCRDNAVAECSEGACQAADPSLPWDRQTHPRPCRPCWLRLGGDPAAGPAGAPPRLIPCPSCKGGVRIKAHRNMPAASMDKLLDGPPVADWPDGWESWPVTVEAHARLLDRAARAALAAEAPADAAGRGIVTCAGGAKYFACAYVLLHLLRRVHGSTLPVEVWHLGPEELDHRMRALLEGFGGVEVRDAVAVARALPAPPRHLGGWEAKVFALPHTRFAEALFLDADQVPLRDPAELFDWPEYRDRGAVLWPDLPNNLGLDVEPEAFRALRLPVPGRSLTPGHHRPSDYRPVESGQLLVDRRRRRPELLLAAALADRAEFFYRWNKQGRGRNLVYGDKSCFALAFWRLAHERGEAPAGWLGEWPNFAMPPGCGWVGSDRGGAFLQRDFAGRPWTAHRCQPTSKWSLHGPNAGAGVVPLHAECEQALADLRTRWAGHPWDWGDQSERDREVAARLAGPRLMFRGDEAARDVTLGADGRVSGWPGGGRRWRVLHDGDAPLLAVSTAERAEVFLGRDEAGGAWQNQDAGITLAEPPPAGWRYPDRMAVDVYHSVVGRNEYRLPDRFAPGDVVLDIGAHVGSFARACLDRGAGRVVCVEPNPELLPMLLHNVGADLRVRVVPAAAWPHAGRLRLSFPQGAEHSAGGRVGESGGVEVPCVAFDELLDQLGAVRLLKLDCEGSEWSLLESSRRLHLVAGIVGEYHLAGTTHTPDDLHALLSPHGFRVEVVAHPRAEGLGHFFARR